MPVVKPVIVDVGRLALLKVGAVPCGPETIVQAPVPLTAVFAVSATAVPEARLHCEMSAPALAVVGSAVTFTTT